MVAGVVMGIDGCHENGRFSTSCTVNVAHTFASGIASSCDIPGSGRSYTTYPDFIMD